MQFYNYFLHALFFFTRVPVGKNFVINEKVLFRSRVLGPVIGFIVGGIEALAFLCLLNFFGKDIALLLAIVIAILITGALHEDGLADSIDAFGAAGHSKKDALTIMKDSRIGTYGSLGLIFAFALSFYSLQQLPLLVIPTLMIFSHVASRFSILPLMFRLDYVRRGPSFKKVMKAQSKQISLFWTVFVGICIVTLGWWFFSLHVVWFVLIILLSTVITGNYYKKRIGGITGDCFGATIKISEIACYLLAVFLYRI